LEELFDRLSCALRILALLEAIPKMPRIPVKIRVMPGKACDRSITQE